MTKKDFELIADIIATCPAITTIKQRKAVTEYFAERLKVTNPSFNTFKFVTACLKD